MGLNKPVGFPTAKLLKEKGFDEKCSHYYIDNFQNFKHDGKLYKTGLPNDWDNDNILQFVKRTNQPHLCNAPTIAEVAMWLYEKHGIWVVSSYELNVETNKREWFWVIIKEGEEIAYQYKDFNSPTEAYQDAIDYVLKNLI
jgi:hypothetical protein